MDSTWTVREVLDWTTGYFRRGSIGAARFEAEVLLSHALQCERLNLYLDPQRPLSQSERDKFRTLVQQRYAGTPLAYLLGEVHFVNTRLKVDQNVLIPRPETEELVECILKDHSEIINNSESFRFLDLGTGSGAIAIALLKAWEQRATGVAVDQSEAALAVARENAQLNEVVGRIEFRCSNWFDGVEGQFDMIVSNPPYIPTPNLSSLSDEVIEHEPTSALDGGPHGTRAIEVIVNCAHDYLKAGGRLYLEIGFDQGERVREILTANEHFVDVEILPDLAGRDRIARAIRRGE